MKTEKHCYRCKETKPISEFYKNRSSYDGYAGCCSKCSLELQQIAGRLKYTPHPSGIKNALGRKRFDEKRIEKNRNNDTCISLKIHSAVMKDDPEHLTTEFMQRILGRKCE